MTDDAWLDALGAELARDHGAVAVLLYGSRARGAARPESDVDLLVLVPDDRAPGAKRDTRRATTPDGREVDVDAWIQKVGDVADPRRDPSLLRLRGGRALVDRPGVVPPLLAALDALAAGSPDPLSDDERQALVVWADRMLRRVANVEAGPIAAWRRAELLVELLPDCYRLRRWWYPGPEPALRELAARAPTLHAAFVRALAPDATVAELASLVALAFADA